MADGFARITGKPQCVIVHVDVGTQALGQAVHNASCGRVPVLIFAGLSPYTAEGELHGSRTEFIHWLQDTPDQRAILSQYCRYTAEIKTGRNLKQLVNRALQFATSDPQGPVYLMGAREVMEEEIEPYKIRQDHWSPVRSGPLPEIALTTITTALVEAVNPLVVVGFTGRNQDSVHELVRLADLIRGLKVYDAGQTDMCFPFSHRACIGSTTGASAAIRTADVILVLDCDVPWIPVQSRPQENAKIFHIDVDPLKAQMSLFYIPAIARYRADSYTALTQLYAHIVASEYRMVRLCDPLYDARWDDLATSHHQGLCAIRERGAPPPDSADAQISISYLSALLRTLVPHDCIFVSEAVTNHVRMTEQLQPSLPGTWFTKGASGLGWANGAALGIKLAIDHGSSLVSRDTKPIQQRFVCSITGDGSFLAGVPSSVYWISAHYAIPFLTIVLNNGGWAAPRRSAALVNPTGSAQRATASDLNLSFGHRPPDYGAVAVAAADGRVWARKVDKANMLKDVLTQAVAEVKGGRSAVVDVVLGE